MNHELDRLLERWAAQPASLRLDALESDLAWQMQAPPVSVRAQLFCRIAAVALALAAGVGMGVASSAEVIGGKERTHELASGARLAPSGLLGLSE